MTQARTKQLKDLTDIATSRGYKLGRECSLDFCFTLTGPKLKSLTEHLPSKWRAAAYIDFLVTRH